MHYCMCMQQPAQSLPCSTSTSNSTSTSTSTSSTSPPERPPPLHVTPPDDTPPGKADAAALEWGAPGFMDVVAQLAAVQPVDVVVATDCCYVDHKADIRGPSPSTEAFMEACAGLCGREGGAAGPCCGEPHQPGGWPGGGAATVA